MVNNLLADFVESGVLGEIGYISVHFAVHLDVLYYILAVGLKSAVEVVQVFDAADFARRGVEELCWDGLRQRVVSLLLISRHEVIAVLHNHLVEAGDFVGRVLKVGIHGDDHVALCLFESAV